MSSSAPLEPESGSELPSLTSNSRVFSIKNPTFSAEMASSGIARSSLSRFRTNAQAGEMIHCAGAAETSIFRPNKTKT